MPLTASLLLPSTTTTTTDLYLPLLRLRLRLFSDRSSIPTSSSSPSRPPAFVSTDFEKETAR